VFFLFSEASKASSFPILKESERRTQTTNIEIVSNPKESVSKPGNRKRLDFVEEITIGESEAMKTTCSENMFEDFVTRSSTINRESAIF
jgi:hypothetical protein